MEKRDLIMNFLLMYKDKQERSRGLRLPSKN